MTAREAILDAIRTRRLKSVPRPPSYHRDAPAEDHVTSFAAQATRAAADVRRLASMNDVPAAVAEALRARNMKARVHFPDGSQELAGLPWERVPGLERTHAAPGPDDAALALAPYGIAETGTLVFSSARTTPASWHFRPGLEIAIIRARDILVDFETVLARVKAQSLPSTLNLVTGPSRTGDIEQTLELGAHGPKALVVLVVEGA